MIAFCFLRNKLNQQKQTLFLFGASLLLGMVLFKTKVVTFCMQAYVGFFTHSFGIFFAHFTTFLRSWSSEVVYFIKCPVLWKFSFSVCSISGFLLRFKQAKSHLSPKLLVRYLLLAKSAIYSLCCNDYNVEKVYEQRPIPFFPRINGRYDSSKRSITLTPPVLLLYKLMRRGCVTSLAPPFILRLIFAHKYIIFTVIGDIYHRVVVPFRNVYLSITAVIACASFFLPKLFALNKLLVRLFYFVLSYGSYGSHAFFQLIQS